MYYYNTWFFDLQIHFFPQLFLSQHYGGSALRARFLLFVQYWQDAEIRTRGAATVARCATNATQYTSLNK